MLKTSSRLFFHCPVLLSPLNYLRSKERISSYLNISNRFNPVLYRGKENIMLENEKGGGFYYV
ncbi:MAG: hypothetical protein QXM02_04160 [Thermoproteota archaeon]